MRVRELADVLIALGGIVMLYSGDLHLGTASGRGGSELLAAAARYATGRVYSHCNYCRMAFILIGSYLAAA
jgi:hypothetical protein